MNNSKTFKVILPFLLHILISVNIAAQSIESRLGYRIALDPKIEINAKHKYIKEFSDKDQDYILWLHTANKLEMERNAEKLDETKVYRNSGGNNSLVFTITEKEKVRYDTLRNSVHPGEYSYGGGFLRKTFGKWKAKRLLRKLDIQGSLPKGAMSSISAKRWGLEVGILVPESTAQVRIEVYNREDEYIATIIDDELRKGWNNYEWKRNDIKRGKYKVKITMNENIISQNFKM